MKTTILSAVVAGFVLASQPVSAQPVCGPRTVIVASLETQYEEALTGGGVQSADRIVEIYASDATGTFTVLISMANGTSCIVASGEAWNSIVPIDAKKGIPS